MYTIWYTCISLINIKELVSQEQRISWVSSFVAMHARNDEHNQSLYLLRTYYAVFLSKIKKQFAPHKFHKKIFHVISKIKILYNQLFSI